MFSEIQNVNRPSSPGASFRAAVNEEKLNKIFSREEKNE